MGEVLRKWQLPQSALLMPTSLDKIMWGTEQPPCRSGRSRPSTGDGGGSAAGEGLAPGQTICQL